MHDGKHPSMKIPKVTAKVMLFVATGRRVHGGKLFVQYMHQKTWTLFLKISYRKEILISGSHSSL
jgi:hypothetical protein